MPTIRSDWSGIRDKILTILRKHEKGLPAESREAVEHYLDVGEYEIAFEGLCLDLIEQRLLTADDLAACVELGEVLGLDEETVLRGDFWALLIEQRRLAEAGSGAS